MDLTISEIRNITKVVNDNLLVDLSCFGSVSLKSRLRNVMSVFEVKSADNFISLLKLGKISKDDFLYNFSVPYTEMFRDPSMWRKLKDDFLSQVKGPTPYRIFIPACSTGDEYYSLLVVLDELDLIEKVKITVSSWSKKTIELVKEVNIPAKKMELNKANYKRFEGREGLDEFFKNNKLKHLQLSTEFINIDFVTGKLPTNQDLIIFRNKFIYMTEDAQDKMIDNLHNCLKVGGKLIVGIKENIFLNNSVKEKFIEVCEADRIYKKK